MKNTDDIKIHLQLKAFILAVAGTPPQGAAHKVIGWILVGAAGAGVTYILAKAWSDNQKYLRSRRRWAKLKPGQVIFSLVTTLQSMMNVKLGPHGF